MFASWKILQSLWSLFPFHSHYEISPTLKMEILTFKCKNHQPFFKIQKARLGVNDSVMPLVCTVWDEGWKLGLSPCVSSAALVCVVWEWELSPLFNLPAKENHRTFSMFCFAETRRDLLCERPATWRQLFRYRSYLQELYTSTASALSY